MTDKAFNILEKYKQKLKTAIDIKCGYFTREEAEELNEAGKELGIQCSCYSCNEAKAHYLIALGNKYFEEVKRREELEKAKEEQLKEGKDDPYAEFRKPYNPEPNKKKGKK